MAKHSSPNISWIKDALPELSHRISLGQVFDIVLLCAVWQHLKRFDKNLRHQLTSKRPRRMNVARVSSYDLASSLTRNALDDADRRIALSALRTLVVDGGKVIISIRHGAGAPTRPVFPANLENTVR